MFVCVWGGDRDAVGQECVYLREDVFPFLCTAVSDLNKTGMSWT